MFKRLGETWNKAVEWYLTTDFFPYPVPFHKMDEKSLGGEMVSAFNKADIGAKINFIEALPAMLEKNPDLIEDAFEMVVRVFDHGSKRDIFNHTTYDYNESSEVVAAAINALPLIVQLKPDLLDSISIKEIKKNVLWWDSDFSYVAKNDMKEMIRKLREIHKSHESMEANRDLLAFVERTAPRNG